MRNIRARKIAPVSEHRSVALIRRIRATGVSVIWIEHIVHALLATVDRIVVLAGGAFIADDRPAAAISHPKVTEIYMGIPAGE